MSSQRTYASRSVPMSDETRGHSIRSRRLALGIKSLREFAEATGIHRVALSKAEQGEGSTQTYERAEAWLDRFEHETGHDEPSTEPIRFTFHDIYGIGELIVEGPADKPDQLIAAVTSALEKLRERKGD